MLKQKILTIAIILSSPLSFADEFSTRLESSAISCGWGTVVAGEQDNPFTIALEEINDNKSEYTNTHKPYYIATFDELKDAGIFSMDGKLTPEWIYFLNDISSLHDKGKNTPTIRAGNVISLLHENMQMKLLLNYLLL